MSFSVGADAYDRFMGRYSGPLAPQFLDFADVGELRRVLDMGCGPGALTDELVARFGPDSVTAVDPSGSFVDAVRARHRGIAAFEGSTDQVPPGLEVFDAVLAQLVVHFMAEPVRGISVMRDLVRPGGIVAATVWDHAEGGGPLEPFWSAVQQLDSAHHGEAALPGTSRGSLGELFRAAGLVEVSESELVVGVTHDTFEEWWQPFTLGVGPAGAYVASLDEEQTELLRRQCERQLPAAPFEITGRAWVARGQRRPES